MIKTNKNINYGAAMQTLNNNLSKIVFKESRGGSGYTSIGWENGESYLRYHSGIFYKWFKPVTA